MARKKQIRIDDLLIVDVAHRGKSVAKDEEGRVYLLDKGVPGDVVDIRAKRKKSNFFQGTILNTKVYSDERVEPVCQHFGVCGGCKWQNMAYEAQLKYKHNIVMNAMTRIGNVDASVINPIVGAENTFQYRNKIEYSFSNKRWLSQEEISSDAVIEQSPALGFHRAGAFDKIVEIEKCHLQDDLTNDIRNFLRAYTLEHNLSYYDYREHTGLMRNVILRNNTAGDWMIILSVSTYDEEKLFPLLDALRDQFPQITSLNYVINNKKNDYILDLDIINYHGASFIVNKLGKVKYKIGTKSFFQTNTKQAEKLFDLVVDFADFKGEENVYDLYTGLGSIALYVADKVKHVTGIEEVEDAIKDARVNASFNQIDNTTFYAGDVKDILTDQFSQEHGKPDVVITDPPRAGMHKDVVQTLLQLEAPKIVYVSCNPATQARDLDLLSEKYKTTKIQPVDMFPHTHHIENVALLELKG